MNKVSGPLDAAMKILAAATLTANTNGASYDFTQGNTVYSDVFPRSGGGSVMQVVMPITSYKVSATDETYAFNVQSSPDGSTWTDCSRIATLGAGTPTDPITQPGLLFLPFDFIQKYYRIIATLGGTSPHVVIGDSYIVPLQTSVP